MSRASAIALDIETVSFDPTSPEFIADPYPFYRALRETTPIFWVGPMNGWLFTRYRDVQQLMKDGRVVKAPIAESILMNVPPEFRHETRQVEDFLSLSLPFTNPPLHTRLRRLIGPGLKPTRAEAMRPRIQEIVDGLIAPLAEQGRMEVVRDLSYRVPASVILEMLGVPVEDHSLIIPWVVSTMAIMGGTVEILTATKPQHGSSPLDIARGANQAIIEFGDYMQRLIDERRQSPRQDILSALISAQDDGKRLSDEELLATSLIFVTGGLETTANLIGNGLHALLRNPTALAELRAAPSCITAAVEELVRFDGPAQLLPPQQVWSDVEIGGMHFKAGDVLYGLVGAANHDPEKFADPDRLDIHRAPNEHLGFGSGMHFCPGATLGRIETEIVIGSLVRRFSRMELDLQAGAPVFRPNPTLRGLARMPVVLGE
jgi:cytochrome P450